jgi:hypothetical protein
VAFLKKSKPTQTKKVEKPEIVSKITVRKDWSVGNIRIHAEGDSVSIHNSAGYLSSCSFPRSLCPQLAEILLQASV